MVHENNFHICLGNATKGSEMISPNSFGGFIFARAIDMNLDPPFLYSRLNKNDWNNSNDCSETVFYRRFWDDICQLILRINPHKGHRYELRPVIILQSIRQKWWTFCDLLFGKCEFYLRYWNDISPNSICGFISTRAVEMDLDPPFL